MSVVKLKIALVLMTASLVGGCGLSSTTASPSTASPTASLLSAEVLPTQTANELIRLAGVGGPYTSAPLHVTSEVAIRANWDQSSAGEFSFGVASQDAKQEAAPDSLVAFELILGPSSGSGEYTLAPGDYVVQVIAADGPWLIWIEAVGGQ